MVNMNDEEFKACDAAYRIWLEKYGHKLSSDGLGRQLFWAGWIACQEWKRDDDKNVMTQHQSNF